MIDFRNVDEVKTVIERIEAEGQLAFADILIGELGQDRQVTGPLWYAAYRSGRAVGSLEMFAWATEDGVEGALKQFLLRNAAENIVAAAS